jgi:hypothetical protein
MILTERALLAEEQELHNDLFFAFYNFRQESVPGVRRVLKGRDDDPNVMLWGVRLLGIIGEVAAAAVEDLLGLSRDCDQTFVVEVMTALLRIAPESDRVVNRLETLSRLPDGTEFERLLSSHVAQRPQ